MEHAQGYFVGIGAQRSGTTWLSHMLTQHPDVGMSPVKETHYFSSKYVDHQRNAVRGLQAMQNRMPKLLRHCWKHPSQTMSWLLAYGGMMTHSDASYRRFIELGRNGCQLAGEITPAYATLPSQAFAALDACLDKPRYIFILRNPADRLISQIAHTAPRDRSVLTASAEELLARPYFAMRASYKDTFETCRCVVEDGRLHTLFFEDLFDTEKAQSTFDALCAFLDISSMQVKTDKVVNAVRRWNYSAVRSDIVLGLKEEYQFAAEQFPDALPQGWVSDLNLISKSALKSDADQYATIH